MTKKLLLISALLICVTNCGRGIKMPEPGGESEQPAEQIKSEETSDNKKLNLAEEIVVDERDEIDQVEPKDEDPLPNYTPGELIGKNLMACQTSSNGKRDKKCTVYQGELASPLSDNEESEFRLNYNFACFPGKKRVKVVVNSTEKDYPLTFGKEGLIILKSKNKILLKDLFPNKTKHFLFEKGCQLVFSEISVTSTAGT